MLKNKFLGKCFIFILAFAFLLVLNGCGSMSEERDYSDLLLVKYDGNGGYLGDKITTDRKIRVEPNSKIPKYLSEYPTGDPYVVPSLGLATRTGFALKGWYLAENATYQEDDKGTFVYLDEKNNNGLYVLDENGNFVEGYAENKDGKFIFIYVEEMPADADPEKTEYIYFEGSEGYGFYLYDPDNADHAAIYEADGGYKANTLTKYGSYLLYADLTDAEKDLFKDAPRFNRAFVEKTENDEMLESYSFSSGYADINSMMEEDPNGSYVFINEKYELYDENNLEHQGLERLSISPKYQFTPTETVKCPSDLKKYSATITYWDFEHDRVTEDIVLLAHWVKKYTVEYIQKTGQITNITTKRNEDNNKDIDLKPGELIGKFQIIPKYEGYTFVGWSKSETEYIPWNFEQEVFPTDSVTLKLYAYMIPGNYTRISTVYDLATVANDPNGNYVLCNDIDLGGAEFVNKTPLGFAIQANVGATITPFTGKFVSLGHKISNFKLIVKNYQKQINANAGVQVISGLFPYVQNATIEGVKIEGVTLLMTTSPMGTNVICDMGGAGLIGTALEGTTIVKDCSVNITFAASSTNVLTSPVFVGDLIAQGENYVTITNSTATIDYSAIDGITTGTFHVQTLN